MFEPVLLRSFVTVAETLGFSAAARRLNLTQSAVSLHIRKLEAAAGRKLFLRDTHSVRLTPDGEAMLGFARTALDAEDRARRFFTGSQLRGRIRFGASEDLVLHGLPQILREFVRNHPLVDLELVVAVSGALHARLADGALDLVFAKRPQGDTHGQLVWRDQLVWFGAPPQDASPLPLVLLSPPSITRARALAALEAAGRLWRIVCESDNQNGIHAAVLAGLGVGVHARSILPGGLAEAPASLALPGLGTVDFVISAGHRRLTGAAAALANVIRDSSPRLAPHGASVIPSGRQSPSGRPANPPTFLETPHSMDQ